MLMCVLLRPLRGLIVHHDQGAAAGLRSREEARHLEPQGSPTRERDSKSHARALHMLNWGRHKPSIEM